MPRCGLALEVVISVAHIDHPVTRVLNMLVKFISHYNCCRVSKTVERARGVYSVIVIVGLGNHCRQM